MCKEFDLISEYYDGELDEAAQKHMEEHLASCAACAEELERYSQMSEVFCQCTQLEPTAEFQAALGKKLNAVAAKQSKKSWKETIKAWLVNWRVTGSFAAACVVFFLVMVASNGGFVKYAPPKPSDSIVGSGNTGQTGKESIFMDHDTAKQPNQSPQSTDTAPTQKQQGNQAGSVVAYNGRTVPLQQEQSATVADAGPESGTISPQPSDATRMVQEPADLAELLDTPTIKADTVPSAQPSLEMAAIPSITPMPAATGVPKQASADASLIQSPPPAALPEASIAVSPIEHTALVTPSPAPAADRAGGVGGSTVSMKGYNFYAQRITRFQVTDLDVAEEVLRRYGTLIETASGKKVYEISNERFEEAYQALAGLIGANSLGVESIDYTAQYNSLNIQLQDVVTNNGDGSAFAKKIAMIENLSHVQYIEITL